MYIYELVLVDYWADQIAKWYVESKLPKDMMHELIDKYNDHIKDNCENSVRLCVTLVKAQTMPSLMEIMDCANSF
jgi:hypothetical protein